MTENEKQALEVGDDEIRDFFEARPALNKSKFSEECGMPAKQVDLFLNANRAIPAKHREKLIERMAHYGYEYYR